MRKATSYVAGFDSASAMLAATARFLHGEGFPRLGQYTMPQWVANLIGAATDALPYAGRAFVYTVSGAAEGIGPTDITQVRAEAIERWAVDMYPKDSGRRYPAIAIGSSNGAAVHLYAALGIPWLPQTVLVPVKFVQPVDDPWPDFISMRPVGRALLDVNPDMQLHHMHDPNQDRLMLSHMTYFRVKLLRLGDIFGRFIAEHLEPGGTLLVMECQRQWPTTQVAPRQIFQFGAVGGASIEEYFHGDQRVLDYLCRYKSDRQRWTPPEPNGERPEAEWGFAPDLLDDVTRLARERGYRVRRVTFDHPRAMSPLVADLYRWWYARRNLPTSRLLVDSFILMDPYWTLRTGSVPYWMTFNVDADADDLERYLDAAGPFDEIGMMLFSNGIRPVGQAPIARWRELLAKARVRGTFVGVAPAKYPSDFAAFARYDPAIRQFTAERYPLPASLTLAELDRFLAEAGQRYNVEWREGATGQQRAGSQLAASQ